MQFLHKPFAARIKREMFIAVTKLMDRRLSSTLLVWSVYNVYICPAHLGRTFLVYVFVFAFSFSFSLPFRLHQCIYNFFSACPNHSRFGSISSIKSVEGSIIQSQVSRCDTSKGDGRKIEAIKIKLIIVEGSFQFRNGIIYSSKEPLKSSAHFFVCAASRDFEHTLTFGKHMLCVYIVSIDTTETNLNSPNI